MRAALKAKLRELVQEFRTVFAGRSNLADSVIPAVVFLAVNQLLGLDYAVWGSLLSYLYGLWRLGRLEVPSVAEFESGAGPPWMGQRRGF